MQHPTRPRRPTLTRSSPGLAQLAPLESTNLHQQAYTQLREALMSGKFAPGEVLTLRGLAAALGTSVMPARDAVLRLTAERALEAEVRGVRVPVMTLERLRDVTRMRVALESEAAMMAAERASPAEIAAMRAANIAAHKMQKSQQFAKFTAANERFHFAVYRAAHNDLIVSLIESLWLQVGPYLGLLPRVSGETDLFDVCLDAHEQLIEAIERRDPEAARAAIVADLKDGNDVFAPFEKNGALSLPEPARKPARRRAAG